ncbi:MAG TPA: hypothetical protein VM555_04570, partial [Tahibacter sp.]|nr:hypothetical protein [Tahibacter sp.]
RHFPCSSLSTLVIPAKAGIQLCRCCSLVVPAQAGIQFFTFGLRRYRKDWIPACAGMTNKSANARATAELDSSFCWNDERGKRRAREMTSNESGAPTIIRVAYKF